MITRIAKALIVVNLINVRFGKARGRKASDLLRGTTNALATDRQPILSLRVISKRFRGIQALENVNLDLCDKEILGLLGDNGAGRSALIEVIAGVYGVDEGRAIFEGGRYRYQRSRSGKEVEYWDYSSRTALSTLLDVPSNLFAGAQLTR